MGTVRRENGQVIVAPAAMEDLVTEIFARTGCSNEEARRIAVRLIGANLRGHDSHGVIRTSRYLQWVRDGLLFPNQTAKIERETPVLAIIDGHYGFGQTVGEQAVDVGVSKAIEHGVAVVALKNAGHLGRIGEWAERAAESNIVSIHMVNVRGSLIVAPFGGVERRSSTSPFCAGIPRLGQEPVILDFATSLVAEGKALVALKGGTPLPQGSLITPDGELASDPQVLYGKFEEDRYPNPNKGPGALCGFGLHKGSGLNFLMEMMGGALTGSGTAGALDETEFRRFCNGMLSIYMAVEFFHSNDWFTREINAYIEFVKSARPAKPGDEVLIPGEKERRTMAKRAAKGLALAESAWSDILVAARSVGMSQGEIDQALAQ